VRIQKNNISPNGREIRRSLAALLLCCTMFAIWPSPVVAQNSGVLRTAPGQSSRRSSLSSEVPRKMTIGLAAPLTGPFASLGVQMQQAARDAVDAINASGGLLGQQVALAILDDACDPRKSAGVAVQFVEGVKAEAVVGHCPRTANLAAEIYGKSNILYVSPFTSTDSVSKTYPNVIHLAPTGSQFGEAAAGFIAEKIEKGLFQPEIGVFNDGFDFGKSLASSFQSALRSKGYDVLFNQTVREPEDFQTLLAVHKPKTLFFAFDNPLRIKMLIMEPFTMPLVLIGRPGVLEETWEEFYRWAREFGLAKNVSVVAPPALGDEFIHARVEPKDWQLRVFDTWRQRAKPPSSTQVWVYTAFDLLKQVMEKGNTKDPLEVRKVLSASEGIPTLLGNLGFDQAGRIKKLPFRVYTSKRSLPPWQPSTAFMLDMGPPEEAAKADGEPVYNIEVEPKESRDPLVLVPQKPTVLDFYIGPRSEKSVAPDLTPDPILIALAKDEPIQLTISLFSYLSEKDTFQQKKVMFDPRKGRSDVARFNVVPSPAAVRENHGLGRLVFVVDADGMEIDIIQLYAIVGEPSPQALEAYAPPKKLKLDALTAKDISVPDLVIAIAPRGEGKLPVIVRPVLPDLHRHLQAALEEEGKDFWSFQSGVTKTDLEGLVADTYKKMRAVAEQHNETLQNIYSYMGEDVDLSPTASMLVFKKEDTEKLLKAMGDEGKRFYWRIFLRGDQNLKKAMDAIDSFKSPVPLRVRILAADVYAPWQILYPWISLDSPKKPEGFWGFRYALGTLQIVDAAQGRLQTVLATPRPDEVLYGAWRGASASDLTDDVKSRAEMIKGHLEQKLGSDLGFSISKDGFLSTMENKADRLKLVFTYGHGSSGAKIVLGRTTDGKEEVFFVEDVTGPCFIFSDDKNEILRPVDLDDFAMKAQMDPRRPCFFKHQPIVILNACETGASGTRSADNNGFVGAFTRLGARAVVVTEAPVWANFAQHFAVDVMDNLFAGDEIRTALHKARLKHLDKWGNPMGLAYTLYGNPAAHFAPQ